MDQLEEYQADKERPAEFNPQVKLSFVLVHDLLENVGGIVSESVVVSKGLSKVCLELVFALTTLGRLCARLHCSMRLRVSWCLLSSRSVTGSGLVNNPHADLLMARACTPVIRLTILGKSCVHGFASLELPSSVLGFKLCDSVLGILSTGRRRLSTVRR